LPRHNTARNAKKRQLKEEILKPCQGKQVQDDRLGELNKTGVSLWIRKN